MRFLIVGSRKEGRDLGIADSELWRKQRQWDILAEAFLRLDDLPDLGVRDGT